MAMNTNGKVQRSAAEWHAILERYEQSGLTTAAFCAREGIAFNSFKKRYYHHKQAMRPATFVELRSPLAATPGWELEVTLPNGMRFHVRG
jgi:hypothetical protein